MKPQTSLLFRGSIRAGVALTCLLSALVAGAAQTPPTAAKSEAGALAQQPAHTFKLSNGMTLIVKPDRRAPTAIHMLWVRVGSMDEVDGKSGIAHVLEHMMFKGTPTVPEGEFSRRVAALGGRENAFTSRDMTAYHQQVPASQLDAVMRLEADRFARNQWPDDAFVRELAVIQEERRQRIEESPQARMFEAFNAMAFQTHPYRRPIIGWMSDLQALKAPDVRAFRQRWYVPGNAAVVVVGDVDVAAVRRMAEQHYGRLPARALPDRDDRIELEQFGERRMEYLGRTQQPMLVMGYPVPKLQSPEANDPLSQDALALALLAGVLDGHKAARLQRTLVQGDSLVADGPKRERLADSVSAYYDFSGRGPQLFTLSATPREGVEQALLERSLKDEVARVAKDGVSEAELQRVKNQWMASEVFKLDSVFAQAQELGSQWILGWPADASALILERLRKVTPEQVQSVAARYFDDKRLNVAWLLPEVKP